MGSAAAISGRDDRDEVSRVELVSDHTLYYDGTWTKVHCTLETPGMPAKGRGFIGGRWWCPRDRSRPDRRIIEVRIE